MFSERQKSKPVHSERNIKSKEILFLAQQGCREGIDAYKLVNIILCSI